MKRFLIMLVVLGLIAASVTTAGATKRSKRFERTVDVTYDAPFVPMTWCGDWSGLTAGCVDVPTRANEAFFKAKATDAHGLPVAVAVYSSDGNSYGVFCGETSTSKSFEPGSRLTFVVGPHWPVVPTDPGCPMANAATTGTISVTFSNHP